MVENIAPYTLFLLGVLQVVTVGLSAWVLLRIVDILQRITKMESKFDSLPIARIDNNRHRIENLERTMDGVQMRVSNIEKICLECPNGR